MGKFRTHLLQLWPLELLFVSTDTQITLEFFQVEECEGLNRHPQVDTYQTLDRCVLLLGICTPPLGRRQLQTASDSLYLL